MKLLSPTEVAALEERRLLAYLRRVGKRLARVEHERDELLDARTAVYKEGRWYRVPPITNGRLADAAAVSEVAIITKLKQLKERENPAAAGPVDAG